MIYYVDFDTKKVSAQSKENPEDMGQKYDVSDDFGSGMNKALDKMREKDSFEIDLEL